MSIGSWRHPARLCCSSARVANPHDDLFHIVLARSWSQFLTDLADELEAGNFWLDLTDPKYPNLTPADAPASFHNVVLRWSRAKLGLRRLSREDQEIWTEQRGD